MRRRDPATMTYLALGLAGALLLETPWSGALLAQEQPPAREARPAGEGLRIQVEDGVLYLPAGFLGLEPAYELHIHFHGSPSLASELHAKSGSKQALLALHRNGFSTVYERWLADGDWLDRRLASVDATVLRHTQRPRAQKVAVSAFSAGYAAVRALLSRERDFARIASVELADALHASYGSERRPQADQMAPFLAFAREACEGRVRFLLTHSEIAPEGYASVRECADYLLAAIELPRERDVRAEEGGLERLTRAARGRFEVLGFAGDKTADHSRHFRRLWRAAEEAQRDPVAPLVKPPPEQPRPDTPAQPELPPTPATADELLALELGRNAALAARCNALARRHAQAWLEHADPKSGLLPRTLRGDAYWNAKDCAADNLPFLALTGEILGDHHLRRATAHLLAQERALCARLDALPDDFDFATQAFRTAEPAPADLIFGAAEFAKDGLTPWFEWTGPGPWLARMQELVRGVWKQAPEGLPSTDVEVLGDLLQACARLAWWTGDERYAAWTFRLADAFLTGEGNLLEGEKLYLRDHGCEVIGGLGEAYVLASRRDPARREAYRPRMHALLDRILEVGRDERGLLYDAVDPRSGARIGKGFSDGFGYVYDAFLCVAEVDGEARYREAIAHVLAHLTDVRCKETPGLGGADGHADAIESALNLMQRAPEPLAAAWVEREMEALCALQREDGVIEGWYGDGNSARTALMVALWKSGGVAPEPWVEGLRCGAVGSDEGELFLTLSSDWDWSGVLRFDRPRHRDVQHLPFDAARINQFPEWFTAERHVRYEVSGLEEPPRRLYGSELWRLPVTLKAGETKRIYVRPVGERKLRVNGYALGDAEHAASWQRELRAELTALFALPERPSELAEQELSVEERSGYVLREIELASTPARRIRALLTLPSTGDGPHPAVVCIHGHGGTRRSVHDANTLYRGFAAALAARGFATIAVDVGQHEIYEEGRTLMGERLFDLMRAVDYLCSRSEIDRTRIGCAGLSLGGEMAMWLGALDERIAATVSAGFLTTMDQLEQGHCPCWNFDGLRERVDFADVYALVAPRALQCQNGLAEPPQDFCVPLAREALDEIRRTYADLGAKESVELHVHDGGHVVDVEALLAFFERTLAPAAVKR